ncbi:hypothetical protein COOONC_21361, partial [Cooperia oncophora]
MDDQKICPDASATLPLLRHPDPSSPHKFDFVPYNLAVSVDVSLFPFDEQRCSLKFGSWTYHGFQVDITNRSDNIDLTNYVPSGEFDLVK